MHPGPVPKVAPPELARANSGRTTTPAHPLHPGWLLGRSLFPIVALTLILLTPVWGPWTTLVLAFVWWRVVTMLIG